MVCLIGGQSPFSEERKFMDICIYWWLTYHINDIPILLPFYCHSTPILLPFYSHYPTIFDYIHPMIFLQSSRCSDQVFVKSWAKRWLKCKRWYKWLIFRCTEKSGESLNTNLLWDILRTKSFCFGMTVLYPSSYCKQSNIAKMILQKYSWKNAHEKTTRQSRWD